MSPKKRTEQVNSKPVSAKSQGHQQQGTFQQEKRTPQRTMVLVEASRTFCVSHKGDFMNDRRQSMLPSPPTHLRNRCENLLHLFLHQHLRSTQTRCRSPCSALRLCQYTEHVFNAAELAVLWVEGGRMHLKEELTELPEENEQARTWLRA